MKWLNLFEGFDIEDYYKCINSEYAYYLLGETRPQHVSIKGNSQEYRYKNCIPLSDSDKMEIQKVYCDTSDKIITKSINGCINKLCIDKGVRFYIDFDGAFIICLCSNGLLSILYTSNLLGGVKVIDHQNIFKLDDEWFIVYCRGASTGKSKHLFYKCDQIGGLIKCLEDNKMVNNVVNKKNSQ